MIALVPAVTDAERLAVAGGEPIDELHTTLMYLGPDATVFSSVDREAIHGVIAATVAGIGTARGSGFAISVFNPGTENDQETCIVLGIGGSAVKDLHDRITESMADLASALGLVLPDQHEPWMPHITLEYTDDLSVIPVLASKVGPVMFDRVRLAFGDDVVDIPLDGVPARSEDWKPNLHPRDHDGKFSDHPGGGIADKLIGDLIHGHHGKSSESKGGQSALDSAPAKLTSAPGAHSGNYEGAHLSGPKGLGSGRALAEYEGLEYETTNRGLRNPQGLLSPNVPQADRDRVAEIDKTMSVSRLTSDVQVDRAIQRGGSVFGKDAWYGNVVDLHTTDFAKQDEGWDRWEAGARPDLTGLRWTDAGYQSTTANPEYAPKFGGRWRESNSPTDGEPVIMTIRVPKGTGGVQLSGMDQEAELLLERGLTMQVVADHGVGDDGFRHLDIEVVGG